MNIFILADIPARNHHAGDYLTHIAANAAAHCDRHVIKMILESAQMLVTASYNPAFKRLVSLAAFDMLAESRPCAPLSASHKMHPCMQWVNTAPENLCYLARLALALCYEKQRRWPMNMRHEYQAWLQLLNTQLAAPWTASNPYYKFPANFAIAIKDTSLRSVAAPADQALRIYRHYYIKDKARFATWKAPASKPAWFDTETL